MASACVFLCGWEWQERRLQREAETRFGLKSNAVVGGRDGVAG